MMTYVVGYYHYFSKLRTEEVDLKRLGKITTFLTEVEEMEILYEVSLRHQAR